MSTRARLVVLVAHELQSRRARLWNQTWRATDGRKRFQSTFLSAIRLVGMRLPPGPSSSLPLVGDLPLIGLGKVAGVGSQPHQRMMQLAEQYGPIMSLKMGEETWTVLSSPEAVHEAFVLRGKDFAGRPMVPSMSISAGGGKGFARATLTPELRALRQTAMTRLFSAGQVSRAADSLDAEARRMVECLLSEGDVDIRPALRRGVTNMVMRYAFSETADDGSPMLRSLAAVVDEIWSVLTATSTTTLDLVTRSTPNSPVSTLAYRKLSVLVSERNAILTSLIRQRRLKRSSSRDDDAHRGPDMLDILLDSGLPEDDVHYTLVDMFVAGTNTVSTALEWLLLILANDPLEQERARRQASMRESAYVGALLCEVMRFKPPLLLPRTATCNSQLGGYEVPRGTVVLANNYALTHGEGLWRDPHLFRPARFLEEESHLSLRGASGSADACKFIPFSIGQRVCPGSRLAVAELEAAANALLRGARWRRSGDSRIDLSEEYSLTLAPASPQRLRFDCARPRRPAARPQGRARAAAMCTPSEEREADHQSRSSPRGRSTRRQKALDFEEASDAERLKEAGTDRRGGWRASKAKGTRRNRRYEKRLLSSVARSAGDSSLGSFDGFDEDD